MTRVFLHVGPHKTGTTAMQVAIHEASARLLAAGLLYPESGQRAKAHHALVDWARGWPADFNPDELRQEIDDAETVLLSSEDFCHLDISGLSKVRDLISPHPVTVIFYLRNLTGLLPSHWQELIKHGHMLSFREYMADVALEVQSGAPYKRLDQAEQVRRLNHVFGQENVRIAGYDLAATRQRNLGLDLLERVIPEAAIVELRDVSVNRSNPSWQTSLLRYVNHIWYGQFGSIAPFTLRVEVLNRLKDDQIAWVGEFQAAEAAWREPIEIRSKSIALSALQERFLRSFRTQFCDHPDDMVEAYIDERVRVVQDIRFPVTIPQPFHADAEQLVTDFASRNTSEP